MCEKGEITSVEEGHDFVTSGARSEVVKDTTSAGEAPGFVTGRHGAGNVVAGRLVADGPRG